MEMRELPEMSKTHPLSHFLQKDIMVWSNFLRLSPAAADNGSGGLRRKRARTARPQCKPPRDGFDRLSDLPKPLLHQIMGLLSNEDKIRMSALSKHFLSACRSHPVVDFDYRTYFRRSRSQPPSPRAFSDHIRDSLQSRCLGSSEGLLILRLRGFDSFRSFDIHAWNAIRDIALFVMLNNVQEVSLNCGSCSNVFGLPRSFFSCSSVKKIFLSGFELGPLVLTVDVPRLEDLTLDGCRLGDSVILSSPKLRSTLFDRCFSGHKSTTTVRFNGSERSIESFVLRGLRNCNRSQFQILNLSSCRKLRVLEVEQFQMDDEWFRDEVSKLFSLEELRMKDCVGPTRIIMRSKRLGMIDMDECVGIKAVHVAAKNLYSFGYNRTGYESDCKITLRECENMRELKLKGAAGTVTDEWLVTNVARFVRLETLVLGNCDRLKQLRLGLERLQRLELIRCKELKGFDVLAPSLESFVFDGRLIGLTAPAGIHSNRLEAEIRFHNFSKNEFKKLRDFLSYFGHCKVLTLSCYRDERFIFPVVGRASMFAPLVDLRHLKVNVVVMFSRAFKLIETALWLAPRLATLRICLNSKPYLTFRIHYRAEDDPQNCNYGHGKCCSGYPVKCWRHSVFEIEFETFPNFEEGWDVVKLFACIAGFPVTVRKVESIMIDINKP